MPTTTTARRMKTYHKPARACPADYAPRPILNQDCPPWHVHTGSIRLYLVGPGEDHWQSCSEVSYGAEVGTAQERAIAERAAQILNQACGRDLTVPPARITAALAEASFQVLHHIPFMPLAPATPPPPPLAVIPRDRADAGVKLCPVIAARIISQVTAFYHVSPEAVFTKKRTPHQLERARVAAIAAVYAAHPHIQPQRIARAFQRDWSTIRYTFIRHQDLMRTEPAYAAIYQKINLTPASA